MEKCQQDTRTGFRGSHQPNQGESVHQGSNEGNGYIRKRVKEDPWSHSDSQKWGGCKGRSLKESINKPSAN